MQKIIILDAETSNLPTHKLPPVNAYGTRNFFKLDSRESDVSPGQTEVKQGKFVEFISRVKGYFRETYKSQNINPISPTPQGVCKVKVFVSI